MTFTIGEAFDLLFGASTKEGPARHQTYESRRWFYEKNVEGAPPVDTGRDEADAMLAARIANCIDSWRTRAGIAEYRLVDDVEGADSASANARDDIGTEAKESEREADDDRELLAGDGPGIGKEAPLDLLRLAPPRMPYDVFAFAAYLVEGAGVYHHLQPSKVTSSHPANSIRHIDITRADRDLVRLAAEAWINLTPLGRNAVEKATELVSEPIWPKIEPLFESWWILLDACNDVEVFERMAEEESCEVPIWWKHAWRLLAVADEAARGTAFQFDIGQMHKVMARESTSVRWFEFEVMLEHVQRQLARLKSEPKDSEAQVMDFGDITSLSAARQAVVSVLPKVRTPAVGCTLRSLSHHLALLPPAGVARGRWTPNYVKPKLDDGSMPDGLMNLLLVPMPYSLHATSFVAGPFEDVSGGEAGAPPRFGYFDVNQHWITESKARPAEIIAFVQALIEAAQKQCPEIHGLIFPELSLDHECFGLVRDHIKKTLPHADILISGIASKEDGSRGNYVAVASFQDNIHGGVERSYRQTVREKHHRWKLERTQLHDYGLLGVLSPELSWWENIALQSRKVDFTVMRRDSVFAAMICEDLARVDPCQQIIRAIGPNLVVALLMDAPQLAARWPARYATVLAEDPGCAVLTLTSRGLMTRQHRLGIFRSNGDDRVVGLWRDDRNAAPTALKCPYDAQAVLLTIIAEKTEDISLDGRSDCDAKAWRYVGDVPVRLRDAKSKFAAILGEEDLACW
jgi:predicted small integral membrane protein